MDVHSSSTRSFNMSRIKGKDTKPEMVVRRLIHSFGFRYRLHGQKLPGRPDLVFASKKKVIFVHGCYWHRHTCHLGKPVPKTRTEFWAGKFSGNVRRDAVNHQKLIDAGWRVLTVWECESRDPDALAITLKAFLSDH